MKVAEVTVSGWWSAVIARSVVLAHGPVAIIAVAVIVWGSKQAIASGLRL
jgi:hypothetical protein